MACKNICQLCPRLIISQSVTFVAGTGLIINLPAGVYANGEKYCIVVAQSIPDTTTISAPVYITIGTGTAQYPLANRCCAQVTACSMRKRTKYSTVVSTTPTGGTFKLLGNPPCAPNNDLTGLTGGAVATVAEAAKK